MDNHEQLVKALRCCIPNPPEACEGCTYDMGGECNTTGMMRDAAAAIEDLQARLGEAENSVERWKDMYLTKHEPKRGEIVRCRECRWGTMCVTGQHLGLDGFCSKGEREVQDG